MKSLQTIAAEWQPNQSSALYAYASTGTIQTRLLKEIAACFPYAQPKELHELQRLYVAVAPKPTLPEIESAYEFWHRLQRNTDGSPVRCRKSGKMKKWKTSTDQFRQPVKYGLKTSFYINPLNIHEWVIAPL